MAELTTMSKLRWEMKKKQLKEEAARKVQQTTDWIKQNKEVLVATLPAAAVIARSTTNVVRSAIRHHTASTEKRSKELYCYDRSLGHYWALKRPLTNSDWILINDRKKNGEKLGDILYNLKVLK